MGPPELSLPVPLAVPTLRGPPQAVLVLRAGGSVQHQPCWVVLAHPSPLDQASGPCCGWLSQRPQSITEGKRVWVPGGGRAMPRES